MMRESVLTEKKSKRKPGVNIIRVEAPITVISIEGIE